MHVPCILHLCLSWNRSYTDQSLFRKVYLEYVVRAKLSISLVLQMDPFELSQGRCIFMRTIPAGLGSGLIREEVNGNHVMRR